MKRIVFDLISIFCVLCSLFSCKSTEGILDFNQIEKASHIRNIDFFWPESLTWENVSAGIDFYTYNNRKTPVRWHLAKIDLENSNLVPVCYPESRDFSGNMDFKGIDLENFMKSSKAVVACNGTPFDYVKSKFSRERKLVGLFINEGELLSLPIEKYAALLFLKNDDGKYCGKIISNQRDYVEFENVEYALGGFFTILEKGEIVDFQHTSKDSRLAVGLSEDGKELYILWVEGELKNISSGATYEECAVILEKVGASFGMQFDGGGSAWLSIWDKKISSYKARIAANLLGFRYEDEGKDY